MKTSWAAGLMLWGLSLPAAAQDISRCAAEADDALRLRCYDALAGRPAPQAAAPVPPPAAAAAPEATPTERGINANVDRQATAPDGGLFVRSGHSTQTLSQRWELDKDDKRGTFVPLPYKPTYILPAFYASPVNDSPRSPTRGAGADVPYEQTEVKFQLSFKTKLWQNLLADNGDIWFGYTQQSNWQLYNRDQSAPFRETNYEPEGYVSFRMPQSFGPWKMLNGGLVHQSNGRADPLSRSWNRLFLVFGLEAGPYSFLIKPWYRIEEDAEKDDNPDIEDYMGRGEVLGIYRSPRGHVASLQLRHSLRGGDRSRGSAKLDWAFPLTDNGGLRGHLQLFSGYGQSMIDYNLYMNAIGIGLSLTEWQ
ncbi:MAG: phospholipase A [Moraxellaceae bacterium]|nr:phospholipase A [Moraxellaceae bacterium]